MAADPDAAVLPATFGFVGVGVIASAVVRGLCSRGGPSPPPSFVLSPRGAAKAAVLAAEFPAHVRVAGSNQEVVDAADCVMIAVLPKQAEDVLGSLTFRAGQQVVSLVATVKLARLREFIAPATECVIGSPLPSVAEGRGATLLIPPRPFALNIFKSLGSCVAVEDEAQFKRMQCITALMGDLYKRQLTAQEWLQSHGVPSAEAAAWVGADFAAMAALSSRPGPDTFAHLVAEQTPGGINEMVWKGQQEDGNYEAIKHSLDSVHHRLMSGTADPSLNPAVKRAKTGEPTPKM
eukprot:CAMPEP_0204561456 /NCGR_PEP_ID=MMETSP0661-20131031/33196_1 /ASSEMBLY_ACC=CAM_ASM_000606 /TAXON_ID=109239 /ORGANISM="Alexandrium margalefi, Strain AMGDE01CS-322" /LENGTH=291 /DNA_ID=CAMNT_0051568867 /DNA_START=35 /DNA_END=910 /DNA_ORIENTATION=+